MNFYSFAFFLNVYKVLKICKMLDLNEVCQLFKIFYFGLLNSKQL